MLVLLDMPAHKSKLFSQKQTNPRVTGVEGEPAHVQIFQLRFLMFSLAESALLERSPEKLSISHNSTLSIVSPTLTDFTIIRVKI